jgi:hypothetical protein
MHITGGAEMTRGRFLKCARYHSAYRCLIVVVTFSWATLVSQACFAQLCGQLSGFTLTENFNAMATTGSNNSLPNSFEFAYNESPGNLTYSADNGSNSLGDTYSYGSTGSTDRALGEITSSAVHSTLGACFTNNTNHAITSFVVGYTGEEWRRGQSGGPVDKLDFQFSTALGATLTSGTYIDVDELDFTSPATATAGSTVGNSAANRTVFAPFAITPSAPIQPESTFYIRWAPLNISGANDGLAIDDFSIGTVLSRGIAGDYNNSGVVDTADYVVWRNTLNQAVTIPNDITPGTVTAQDYIEWKDRLDKTIFDLGAASTVPEPATLLMAFAMVAALPLSTLRPNLHEQRKAKQRRIVLS